MKLDEEAYLAHYGILRKSGRYPWGSGDNPLQRSRTFLDTVESLRQKGMSDPEIARSFSTHENPFTTRDLRALKSISSNLQKQEQIRTAQSLKDKGMGDSEIGRQMSVNESTVRSLLEPGRADKLNVLQQTADMLKRQVDEKEIIDIGAQVERDLPIGDNPETRVGISHDKFQTAVSMLKEQGYEVHTFKNTQVGTGEQTRYKVLTKPGMTQKEAWNRRNEIRLISEKSDDGGRTFNDRGILPPLSISSKRVDIRYKEDGGADADGVIYVRPNVPDVSLGKSRYAQVRIAVDGTHYLKGMAVYKDDLPNGVDLQFNTNKSNTGNKHDAMKPMKDDDNPFGAVIKPNGQLLDKDGNVSSVMNKINDEGDWNKWSKNISRQVLSKQSPDLAASQLEWTHEKRRNEFDEIKSLTNPLIRQKLLDTFADETDSAAVHLKAANMPRQATKVILPGHTVKTNEIFAPTFRDGERVVLIRYPHAGLFEIPELTVNNKNREAQKLLGGSAAPDAVVIHPKVAERLSGADFDGDSVVVIPNNRGLIQTKHPLDGLKDFDPQKYKVPKQPSTEKNKDGSLKYPDGKPIITDSRKQQEMGNITNLISDMTIKGANSEELARAVRHSMVVIDSEKHNLDFKESARDNNIVALKRRYQGITDKGGLRGASTLITRATSQQHVPKRKPRPAAEGGPVDRATGKRVFVPTDERKPNGEIATIKSKKLAETDDAFTLLSDHGGTKIERVYAEHSNRLKALANEARKESVNTQHIPYSPAAKKAYAAEVKELNSQLDVALKNAPLERKAQAVANAIVAQARQANPNMERDDLKKIKGQALTAARARTGAGKTRVQITPRQWEAIQAGAISKHRLGEILKNTDVDKLKELATPRNRPVMTPVMSSRAKSMLASGYSLSDVSDHLGIPMSTLTSALKEEVN